MFPSWITIFYYFWDMTAVQSLKIYETLNKHFNNSKDAKLVVEQIEQIV